MLFCIEPGMIDQPRNESATAKPPGAAGTGIAVQDLECRRREIELFKQSLRQLTHGATSVCAVQHPRDSTDRHPILLHSGKLTSREPRLLGTQNLQPNPPNPTTSLIQQPYQILPIHGNTSPSILTRRPENSFHS